MARPPKAPSLRVTEAVRLTFTAEQKRLLDRAAASACARGHASAADWLRQAVLAAAVAELAGEGETGEVVVLLGRGDVRRYRGEDAEDLANILDDCFGE